MTDKKINRSFGRDQLAAIEWAISEVLPITDNKIKELATKPTGTGELGHLAGLANDLRKIQAICKGVLK